MIGLVTGGGLSRKWLTGLYIFYESALKLIYFRTLNDGKKLNYENYVINWSQILFYIFELLTFGQLAQTQLISTDTQINLFFDA